MDDARKKILARRAQFIAAALAGLGTDACGKLPRERTEPDATVVQTYPMECLAMAAPPRYEPAPDTATPDAATPDAAPAQPWVEPARPHVCLKPAPGRWGPSGPRSPQPCLFAAPPPDDDEG